MKYYFREYAYHGKGDFFPIENPHPDREAREARKKKERKKERKEERERERERERMQFFRNHDSVMRITHPASPVTAGEKIRLTEDRRAFSAIVSRDRGTRHRAMAGDFERR